MNLIEIYGQSGCIHCQRAVDFCRRWGFGHVYHDIRHQDRRAEMYRRNPKAAAVPQIFIGEVHVGGADDLQRLTIHQIQQMIGE